MKTLQALIAITLLSSVVAFQPAIAAEPSTQPAAEKAGPVRKTTKEYVRKEVKEAAGSIKSYTAEQRDEAVKEAKASLDALDARMEKLEKRIEEKRAEWNQAMVEQKQKALEEMRKQRNELAEWYGGLKHSSKEAWESVKTGFTNSYEKLEKSFEKEEEEPKTDANKTNDKTNSNP